MQIEMFRFPILQLKEIIEILDEIQFDDPQVIYQPSKTIIQELYVYITHLVQIHELPEFQYDKQLNYNTLPILQIFLKSNLLLKNSDVPDFSILDLIIPDTQRSRVHLSAVINFLRQQEKIRNLIKSYYSRCETNFQQIRSLQTEKREKVDHLNQFIQHEEQFRPLLQEVNTILESCQNELKTTIEHYKTVNNSHTSLIAKKDQLLQNQHLIQLKLDETVQQLSKSRSETSEFYIQQVKFLDAKNQKEAISLQLRNISEEISGKLQIHTGMRELHTLKGKLKGQQVDILEKTENVNKIFDESERLKDEIQMLEEQIMQDQQEIQGYKCEEQVEEVAGVSNYEEKQLQREIYELLDNLGVQKSQLKKLSNKTEAISLKKDELCGQMCEKFNDLLKGYIVQAQETELRWVGFLEQEKKVLNDK